MDSLASSLVLEQVNSIYWQRYIYKSTPINGQGMRGTNAPEMCALLDPAELSKCDMVLMDDSHCYFGNFSMANGSVSWEGGRGRMEVQAITSPFP